MNTLYGKDVQALIRIELEKNAKVRALVGAYGELTETDKALFRLAVGISQDATSNSAGHRRGPNREPGSGDEYDLVQPLVRRLMKTLLEDYPTLLTDADIHNLMSRDYCQKVLGLYMGGFPLLRGREAGRKGSDNDNQDRYYVKLYADRFYLCSQWWKDDHLSNAKSLLRFVTEFIQRKQDHPGVPVLERHRQAFRDYIGQRGSARILPE